MKANELIIGDYIEHIEGSNPIQIEEIHTDGVIFSNVCYLPYEEIKPIPLTTEILKKNGFNETFWGGEWTNDNVDFILIEHNDGFRVIDTNIVLSGIHHFQHALRLCGIEKEIEL